VPKAADTTTVALYLKPREYADLNRLKTLKNLTSGTEVYRYLFAQYVNRDAVKK
jgi:hypothetical protein